MKPTLFNLDVQTFEKEEETVAEVDIDGIIGMDMWADEQEQNTKQKMREQLKAIDSIDADRIIVNISSLGGDVDHGLAIHDLLAANPASVETNVIGMTASAATIIAQAGDERFMSDNALYLVHRAWTIGMGNANDFDALAKDLEKLDGRISNIYAKRSEKDQDAFMELMNESNGDGIWINADEAKGYGLIDSITEPMKAAAMPKEIFEKYNIPKPPQAEDDVLESTISDLTGDDLSNLEVTGSLIVSANTLITTDNSIEEKEKQESTDVDAVSASSRERAELELLKLK